MGSGKTSVGRKLSALLSYEFIDLDDYIVGAEGRSIPEIFESEGEEGFRRIEKECLQRVLDEYESSGKNLVLSLGGGAVTTPECLEAVHDRTVCFYLKGSPAELRSHLGGDQSGRPMLQTGRLEEILSRREPLYSAAAHHTILIDGRSVRVLASRIASSL